MEAITTSRCNLVVEPTLEKLHIRVSQLLDEGWEKDGYPVCPVSIDGWGNGFCQGMTTKQQVVK